ncbi:sensor histidine kinase [Ruania halotolerans]|uniref:sensor histidine kinase n=1 Tax=Ruania halotolerans TaxID=2897773 RepID=UPI001E2D3AD2|nr:sensor histidine kinase [Ruania halotolerans]UFU08200.1 sensor histidine kinase [Ruania halotolerans]
MSVPTARPSRIAERMSQWWSTRTHLILTSLGCTLGVGLAVLLDAVLNPQGIPHIMVLWWIAYVIYCTLLLAIHELIPRPRRLSLDAMLLLLIALGITLVLLPAAQGWLALLFVMTATMASFHWSPRAVFILIGVQSPLVVVMGVIGQWPTVDLVVGPIIFGISQAFGALVVFTARSEADARRELAVAHAELRSTAALLELTTREAERLRISRDLHDLTGHHLTALSLELETASHLTADGAGSIHVKRAKSIAKDLLGTVRTAVGQMRADPPALEPALRQLAAAMPSLDIRVECEGSADLTVEQTVTILRCVQEAITNTLRHTDARSARIRVAVTPEGTTVLISDDGEGVAQIVPGNGLTGMRERFTALGGSLQVASRPGAGFTVTGTLPCEHDGS